MKTLDEIRAQLAGGGFEYTQHAAQHALEREITDGEIIELGPSALLLEAYPDDKYGPSMLLLGFTLGGRPLHLQVSTADTSLVRIVTVYDPDPSEWEDYRRRR